MVYVSPPSHHGAVDLKTYLYRIALYDADKLAHEEAVKNGGVRHFITSQAFSVCSQCSLAA